MFRKNNALKRRLAAALLAAALAFTSVDVSSYAENMVSENIEFTETLSPCDISDNEDISKNDDVSKGDDDGSNQRDSEEVIGDIKEFLSEEELEGKYIVVFDGNGSSLGEMEPVIMEVDKPVTIPENVFVKYNYKFAGWNTKADGSGTEYTDTVEAQEESTELVLYAQWKPLKYKLILLANGGDQDAIIKPDLLAPASITFPVNKFTRDGYTFKGWSETKDGSGEIYGEGTIKKLAQTEDAVTYKYYAIWEPAVYRITFDANGGILETDYKDVCYSEPYGELPTPVRINYIFLGWFTKPEEGIKEDETTITKVLDKKILYAHWECGYKVAKVTSDIEKYSEVKVGDRISLSSDTDGATIYYTLDGRTPNENSFVYTDAIVVENEKNIVIKAYAVKDNYIQSDITTFEYSVKKESLEWGDVIVKDREAFDSPSEVPSGLWVAGIPDSVVFNGKTQTLDIRVYNNKTLLTANSSYKVTYKNNKSVGKASVTIKGQGNYKDSIKKYFQIEPMEIEPDMVLVPNVQFVNKMGTASSNVTIVTSEGVALKKGTDYEVKYYYSKETVVKNGSRKLTRAAGSKVSSRDVVPSDTELVASITGLGNYKTEVPVEKTYKVTSEAVKDISKAKVSIPTQYYTGYEIDLMGKITVKIGDEYLAEGVDFKIVGYSNDHTNMGTATVTIAGIYNPNPKNKNTTPSYCSGTKTVKFTIKDRPLSKVLVNDSNLENWPKDYIPNYEYTGNSVTPSVVLVNEGKTLVVNKDYTIKYTDNKKLSSSKKRGTITITGKGNYSGTVTRYYNIVRQELEEEDCEVSVATVYATGLKDSYKTEVLVKDRFGKTLTENKDYKLHYVTKSGDISSSYIPAADDIYHVRIEGIKNYSGLIDKTIRVVGQKPVETYFSITVTRIKAYYSKKGAKLDLTVTDTESNRVLSEGTDYSVTYKNNIPASVDSPAAKPIVTITGKGIYAGSVSYSFSILKNEISTGSISATDKIYNRDKNGFISKPVVKDCFGSTLVEGTDYTVTYKYAMDTMLSNGTIKTIGTVITARDIPPVGTKVLIEITGKGNYTGTLTSPETFKGSNIYSSYKIVAGDLSKAKVSVKEQGYTGKAITPGKSMITVKLGGVVLTEDDYEIVGYNNNTSNGTAQVVIRGKGNYIGTKTANFKITQSTLSNIFFLKLNNLKSEGK